jgi:hypothetical protein
MATKNHRGQMITELMWALLLVIGFAVFITRLYDAAQTTHERARWETKQRRLR